MEVDKKKLRRIVYKDALGDEFEDWQLNGVMGATNSQYWILGEHLKKIVNSMKGKSKEVVVDVEVLKGDYILKPKFTKVKVQAYKYFQTKLEKLNTSKKVQYDGEEILIDDEFSFTSSEKLDVAKIYPYAAGSLVDDVVCFSERSVSKKLNPDEYLGIYNSDKDVYYLLDNSKNYTEMNVEINDVNYVLDELGFKSEVIYSNDTFLAETEVDNDYFDTFILNKSTIRVKVSGNDREDNVFADIDYFFEELEGKMYAIFSDDSRDDISVVKRYRNRNELIIALKGKDDFTQEPVKLSFELSTNNIDRQQKSFYRLMSNPSKQNKGLIKIAYGKSRFTNETPKRVSSYRFLTDIDRDGTKEQRKFVSKAMATKDFMLLSGPPGTGKTTCILELIYQIVKYNPAARILLSASTHIAIDNVLERIVEEFGDKLTDNNIYPIRLGRESAISDYETVKDYSYEHIAESDLELAEEYLRSANLVCGTAMGINKYIRDKEGQEKHRFDYLIIDEASKTTLQEYIVPALMCERHVLIGDVNQLSPYTDTFMLEVILKSQKQMNINLEKVFYYNFMVNKYRHHKHKNVYVIDDVENIERLKRVGNEHISVVNSEEELLNIFEGKDILINRDLYLSQKEIIPNYYKIYTLDDLPSSYNKRLDNSITEFVDRYERDRDTSENVIDSNWAKEVAWRYARYHELQKMDPKLKIELDYLILDDFAKGLKQDIEKLADISIPSILVKLQKGVSTVESKFPSTLTKGFSKEELSSRFEQLIYQHRMHPDISKYAEVSIYEDNKFKSSDAVKYRSNTVNIFSDNSIFVNVVDKKPRRKDNPTEAKEIIRVLSEIIKKSETLNQNITVAVLTFYKAQQKLIKQHLNNYLSQFNMQMIGGVVNINNVKVELYTVDKYQGKEADITINSLTRNRGLGFMNVPNRINVALTRAKYYRVVVGDREHFENMSHNFLKSIVTTSKVYEEGELK